MARGWRLPFFLAHKAITRGNKGTLGLTILVMSLAFVNLIFMSSILLGLTDTMNNQAIDNMFGHIVIEPEEDEAYIKQLDYHRALIDGTPGVVGSSAHYVVGASIRYDENNDGEGVRTGNWSLKSVNPDDEERVTEIHRAMVAGEYLNASDRNKIVLGKEISGGYGAGLEHESLGGVEVGDEVLVVYGNGVRREYEVKGIFSTKHVQTDIMAFVTEKEMESVLGVHNRASEIIVKIDRVGEEAGYIEEFRRIGLTQEEISPWTDYMGMTASMVESFVMIESILAVIGLLVAGITVFIVIFVNVVNRKRQIGILKAIGMEKQTIVRAYVLQALFYAVIGIGLGLAATYFVIVPYFLSHPLDFPIGMVSLVPSRDDLLVKGAGLIVASIVGAVIPSWRAARESILKAIWGT